jgi:hypothetical protein
MELFQQWFIACGLFSAERSILLFKCKNSNTILCARAFLNLGTQALQRCTRLAIDAKRFYSRLVPVILHEKLFFMFKKE